MRHSWTHRSLGVAIWLGVGSVLVCGGCQMWEPPKPTGAGSPDDSKAWTDQMRPESSGDVPTGTSPKARDIERNLGYR